MLDFSRTGTADEEQTTNGRTAKAGAKKETLEQLLLARNKKLGSDLTLLRVSHEDLTQRLAGLQQTLDTTTSELASARALNQKLEDDLFKFQQETQHSSSALSVAGTYVSRYPSAQSLVHGGSNFSGGGSHHHLPRRAASPASSIISGAVPHSSSQLSLETLRAAGEPAPAGGSGILPMVTAQRDRFKQKNQQLEDELSRANKAVSNLRQEVSSLQKDNLKLYEKTRYISSYSRQQHQPAAPSSPLALQASNPFFSSSSSTGYGANPNPSSTLHPSNSNSGSNPIDRYRQAYESNISPFEAFRGRESARAFHRMGVAERVIYSLTRVVLANRTSRNLFAGYCLLLHVLVLTMMYYAAGSSAHVDGFAAASGGAGMAAGAAAAAAGEGGGDWRNEGFDERG